MIPKKFLIGGATAVGTAATTGVVVNQYIKPSPEQQRIENNRRKVTDWLEKNKGTNDWKIKIKDGEKTKKLKDVDPGNLSDYLNAKTELLKSLASKTKATTFTFGKSESGTWENIFTKEQILAWVESTSEGKAALKVSENNQLKDLSRIDDLNKLFKTLEKEKTLFSGANLNGYGTSNKKTILFEKCLGSWYHTRTAIEKWKDFNGFNNFEIKIKKDDTNTIGATDEGNLVGLIDFFLSNEVQWKSSTYNKKSKDKKVAWIFERKENKWKRIYSQSTISDWIENVSGKKAKLELHDDNGSIKELSKIHGETELKQLFDVVSEEENLFGKGLDNYNEKDPKVVVFEKYKSWMHVKDAIKQWIIDTTKNCVDCKLKLKQIKIQNSENSAEKKKIEEVEDNKLIGLLKHMKEKTEEYKKEESLTLKKDSKSKTWQKVTA